MDIASVYSRFGEPLYRFIFRFTGNREAAEEILHDTFIQLVDGKFSGNENEVKNWLYTVARNKALNHLKRQRVPVAIVFEPNERLLQLQAAEGALPEDLKQTWELRKDGLDYQEIAETLSIPVGTVKSRFFRLVKFMKKEFADDT